MRTALNKSNMIPHYENKVLQTVENVAASLQKETGEKQKYLEGLNNVQQEIKTVNKKQENAETIEEFEAACEEEKALRQKERFWQQKIDKYEFIPLLSEEEYYGHVSAVEDNLKKEAAAFREIVGKAVDDIMAAYDEYVRIAEESDRVLTDLDEASRFLQSMYRYRVITRQGMDPVKVEDPHAWGEHAKRFCWNGRLVTLATCTDGKRDQKLMAAWMIAERMFGRRYAACEDSFGVLE